MNRVGKLTLKKDERSLLKTRVEYVKPNVRTGKGLAAVLGNVIQGVPNFAKLVSHYNHYLVPLI